jgi:hypothetical protein
LIAVKSKYPVPHRKYVCHRQPFSIDTVSFDACVADDGLTLTLDHGLAAS